MVRYFGQTLAHWLDHGTLHDWSDVYEAELLRCPPSEAFLADYFGYKAPSNEVVSDEIEEPLPDYEA